MVHLMFHGHVECAGDNLGHYGRLDAWNGPRMSHHLLAVVLCVTLHQRLKIRDYLLCVHGAICRDTHGLVWVMTPLPCNNIVFFRPEETALEPQTWAIFEKCSILYTELNRILGHPLHMRSQRLSPRGRLSNDIRT